jgi:hypothetical protein
MTDAKIYTEVIRLVGEEGDEPLTVGPDADGLGCVRIHAASPSAQEYWGKVDLVVAPNIARALAQAMLLAADEAEANP